MIKVQVDLLAIIGANQSVKIRVAAGQHLEKWLKPKQRIQFYTQVLGMDTTQIYKTWNIDRWYPECLRFVNGKMDFFTNMESKGSIPVRKIVTW